MIGSDPAPAQRVNQVTAGGNNLQKRAIVTRGREWGRWGINTCIGGEVLTGGGGVRGDQQGGCWGKNVISESAMSNLQQSHHLTGVEVDASASGTSLTTILARVGARRAAGNVKKNNQNSLIPYGITISARASPRCVCVPPGPLSQTSAVAPGEAREREGAFVQRTFSSANVENWSKLEV